MQLNPNLFITPVIALIFLLWAYFLFRKKISKRLIFRRYLMVMGLLAFSLNWIWEVTQGSLYESILFDLEHKIKTMEMNNLPWATTFIRTEYCKRLNGFIRKTLEFFKTQQRLVKKKTVTEMLYKYT